jgi:alpha-galactosidase/6-phospho-beta-glucosidase family protein
MSKRPSSVLARACASICLAIVLAASSSVPGGVVSLHAQAQARAQTQDRAEIDRDVQELRAYRLTMPKVKQIAAATLAYAQAQSRDPRVQARRNREKELTALEAKSEARLTEAEQRRREELRAKLDAEDAEAARRGDDEEPKTLGDMARRIDREPDLANAIRGTGLTTREYSMLTLSFFNAMFALNMKKTGAIKELPADILPENIAFIQSNEAELNQIFAQLQAYDR